MRHAEGRQMWAATSRRAAARPMQHVLLSNLKTAFCKTIWPALAGKTLCTKAGQQLCQLDINPPRHFILANSSEQDLLPAGPSIEIPCSLFITDDFFNDYLVHTFY
jgi:hypothetical protein